MDRERRAINNIIPYLDDDVFQQFAGLYNAKRLEHPVTPAEEVEMLRYVLQEEQRRTGDLELFWVEELLDRNLI